MPANNARPRHDIRSSGVGLRAPHFRHVVEASPRMGFFEIHAENFMGAGGPPHRYLSRIREDYPLSIHGVGLSIGGVGALDRDHLGRLRALVARYEPALFSEHLAWSTHEGVFFNDLLPLPYDEESLARIVAHIDEVQNALGRRMLLENPSTYLGFSESTLAEPQFLAEIAARTGCALLLDVSNVFIACNNNGWDRAAYLDAFPLHRVEEIHLAGFTTEAESDAELLIDTHDRPVDSRVWDLYAEVVSRVGFVPTLVEWDQELPLWQDLAAQAAAADRVLLQGSDQRHVAVG